MAEKKIGYNVAGTSEEEKKVNFSVAQGASSTEKETSNLQKIVEKFGNVETYISGKYIFKPEYCEKVGRYNYVSWGEDNLFPQHLINILNAVPEHSAACRKYTDLMAGNGFQIQSEISSNFKAFITNKGGEEDLADTAYKLSYDLNAIGAFALEIHWSSNGKNIAYVNHIPIHKIRYEAACKENNNINGWRFCENWAKTSRYKPIFIPDFDPSIAKKESIQIYFVKQYNIGSEVYSIPSYFSVLNWILLEYNIGLFHISNIRAGYKPSVIFSFKQVPEQHIQDKLYEQLEKKYAGAENAGCPVLLFSPSEDQKPEILVVQPNSNDTQYQQLIDIVTQKILSGWRVTNPEILGLPSSKGINSSGNDMLVAEYRLQKTVIDQLQLFVEKHLNYLASFNNIIEPVMFQKYMNDEKFRFLMSLFNTRTETAAAPAASVADNTQQQRNITNQ